MWIAGAGERGRKLKAEQKPLIVGVGHNIAGKLRRLRRGLCGPARAFLDAIISKIYALL